MNDLNVYVNESIEEIEEHMKILTHNIDEWQKFIRLLRQRKYFNSDVESYEKGTDSNDDVINLYRKALIYFGYLSIEETIDKNNEAKLLGVSALLGKDISDFEKSETGNQLKAKIKSMENQKLENQKQLESLQTYKKKVDLLIQKNLEDVDMAIGFVDQKIDFVEKYVL